MNKLKNKFNYFSLCFMLMGSIFVGCKDNKCPNDEILKPLVPHLEGKWLRTAEQVLKNGKWVDEPIDEGTMEIIDFRTDGTARMLKTNLEGRTAMIIRNWEVDEDSCTFKMTHIAMPVFRLTADEFGFSYHQAYDPKTNELKDGGFRWIYSRQDTVQKHPAERLLGKWTFSRSYERKNGEWVESSFGKPDEGWHEYCENGEVVFHSSVGDEVQECRMVWNTNCTTGEMRWSKEWGAKDFITVNVSLDDDSTMTVLYSKNYDPTTGKVKEGEFKDVLIRTKK